jgi:hypothetical protein
MFTALRDIEARGGERFSLGGTTVPVGAHTTCGSLYGRAFVALHPSKSRPIMDLPPDSAVIKRNSTSAAGTFKVQPTKYRCPGPWQPEALSVSAQKGWATGRETTDVVTVEVPVPWFAGSLAMDRSDRCASR